MEHAYACLLCDEKIKSKDNEKNTLSVIKKHLKSTSHKLKYLVSVDDNKLIYESGSSTSIVYHRPKHFLVLLIGYLFPRCYKKRIET